MEACIDGGLLQGWRALSATEQAWDLMKKVIIIFATSTTVWPQVKQQGGNTATPMNRKLY